MFNLRNARFLHLSHCFVSDANVLLELLDISLLYRKMLRLFIG